MIIYFDLDKKELVPPPGYGGSIRYYNFTRGDHTPLELHVTSGGEEVTDLTNIVAVIKQTPGIAVEALAIATAWTNPEGAPHFISTLNLNGESLDTLLGTAKNKALLFQVSCHHAGSGPITSQLVTANVGGDLHRGDEGTPLELPGPDEWLDERRPPALIRTSAQGRPVSPDYGNPGSMTFVAAGDQTVVDGDSISFEAGGSAEAWVFRDVADPGLREIQIQTNWNDSIYIFAQRLNAASALVSATYSEDGFGRPVLTIIPKVAEATWGFTLDNYAGVLVNANVPSGGSAAEYTEASAIGQLCRTGDVEPYVWDMWNGRSWEPHTPLDDYYTSGEVDTLLSGKAAVGDSPLWGDAVTNNEPFELTPAQANFGRRNAFAADPFRTAPALVVDHPTLGACVLNLVPYGKSITGSTTFDGGPYDLPVWYGVKGGYDVAVYARETVEGRPALWCLHDPFDVAHPYTHAAGTDCRVTAPWAVPFTAKYVAGAWNNSAASVAVNPLDASACISAAKSVASSAARLALSVENARGFAVIDADTGKTWMLVANGSPATSGDWLQLGANAVSLSGNETIAGNKSFSGQVEFTGQSASNGTSGLSRDLANREFCYVPIPMGLGGTGGTANTSGTTMGNDVVLTLAGTSVVGNNRYTNSSNPLYPFGSGQNMRFADSKLTIMFDLDLNGLVGNDVYLSLGVGSAQRLNGAAGYAVRWKDGGTIEIQIHNGTTLQTQAAGSVTANALASYVVVWDAGTLSLYRRQSLSNGVPGRYSLLGTLTGTGLPTTAAGYYMTWVNECVTNGSFRSAAVTGFRFIRDAVYPNT